MNNKQIKFLMAVSLALMATFAVLAVGLSESDDATDTTDLQALVDAGGTVTLQKDYNITVPIVIAEGKTVTIDLNGHKIYNTSDIWNVTSSYWSLISVQGGVLTVCDSQWDADTELSKEISAMTSGLLTLANDCYAIDLRTGYCYLESGNFIGNITSIYNYAADADESAVLEITGGLFRIQQLSSQSDYRFTINCLDASYSSGKAVVRIAGGSFYEFDPSDNLAEGAGTDFSLDGSTWTESEDYYSNYSIVTFVTNGGSDIDPVQVYYGAAVAKPSDPTREGYAFKGWYSDVALSMAYNFTTAVTESFSLYAKWESSEAQMYTVTFMSEGSTYYATKVESGKMAVKPDVDPTKSNSRFLGWYTTSGVTSISAEKFDFSTKITDDLTLYAGWIATCTIALPDSIDNCTLSVYGTNTVNVSTGSFSFDVTPAAGYTATVTITQDEDREISGITAQQTITITDLSMNAAVYVKLAAADGSCTETSKTVTENTDGTTTTIDIIVETSVAGDVAITETTSTDDDESTTTYAEASITDMTATLTVKTSSTDVAKVTETIVYAITEAAEAAGTTEVDIDVTVSTKTIELPKVILNNENVRSLTVNVNTGSANSAKISIPVDVLYDDDMADTISLSVTSSSSKPATTALKGSSAIAAFDLVLTGTNTTTFNSAVSISYDVSLPSEAKNVRAYCIDTGEFVKASYSKGTADFDVPHFSAWTIVYDEPTVVVDDDDDILFILEQQKKAQEAASSQTTSEDNSGEEAAVIIAAAAVAGAMLACAFFAFRKN